MIYTSVISISVSAFDRSRCFVNRCVLFIRIYVPLLLFFLCYFLSCRAFSIPYTLTHTEYKFKSNLSLQLVGSKVYTKVNIKMMIFGLRAKLKFESDNIESRTNLVTSVNSLTNVYNDCVYILRKCIIIFRMYSMFYGMYT